MSRLDELLPAVRPILSRTELEELQAAASADSHFVLGASHVARKDGAIVGYLGVATVPLLSFWAHSKLSGRRETMHLVSVAEALMASQTPTPYLTICATESPLRPLMEPLGYTQLPTGLYIKGDS